MKEKTVDGDDTVNIPVPLWHGAFLFNGEEFI